MTRREWLKQNPPPQPDGPLLDRAGELERKGDADGARILRSQAFAAKGKCKCAVHPNAPLYRHQNRQEDLFVCQQGPHFLWWTLAGGRAQIVPTIKLDLPDLDNPMPGV